MTTESYSQQRKRRLYEEGKCKHCEAPLLPEELDNDAKRCGVCKVLNAQNNAMKRSTRPPHEIAEYYGRRIAEEQGKRRRAGFPDSGRAKRDERHAQRKARRR